MTHALPDRPGSRLSPGHEGVAQRSLTRLSVRDPSRPGRGAPLALPAYDPRRAAADRQARLQRLGVGRPADPPTGGAVVPPPPARYRRTPRTTSVRLALRRDGVTFLALADAVAFLVGVDVAAMLAKSPSRHISPQMARARKLLGWAALHWCKETAAELGRLFGGRNPSTISWCAREIREGLATRDELLVWQTTTLARRMGRPLPDETSPEGAV